MNKVINLIFGQVEGYYLKNVRYKFQTFTFIHSCSVN